MKRILICLTLAFILSCHSDTNKKDTNSGITDESVKQEQLKNEPEIVNYTMDELFYFQDISNGNLLATSSGKLSTQTERAMVFVPAGGGEEDAPEFKVLRSGDVHITLSDHKIITDYHLFNFPMNNDALLLKYEANTLVQLIKYSAENNSFKKVEMKQYGIEINQQNDSIHFLNDTTFMLDNKKYYFNGQKFVTIK